MPISTLPPSPARTQPPSEFISKADVFLPALEDFGDDVNALAELLNAMEASASNSATTAYNNEANSLANKNAAAASAASVLASSGTDGTSSTSLTITSGNISLTTQTGKNFSVGAWVKISRISDVSKSMTGKIVSYNSGTGALVVSILPVTIQGSGSGPYADWTIKYTSIPGNVFNTIELSNVGPSVRPSLLCDFANSKRIPSGFVYTMASQQTYFDAVGNLKTSEANIPTFDHDPITGKCLGLSVWESRTNWNSNNTMQGALVGTPGTLPTNWIYGGNGGLTRQVVAIGNEGGMDYIDIRFYGITANVANPEHYISFDPSTSISATSGQTYTSSVYTRVVGGSLNGAGCEHFIIGANVSNSTTEASSQFFAPSFEPLRNNRNIFTRTLTNPSTTHVHNRLDLNLLPSSLVDVTLRISLPQLERAAFATPVIKTTNAAVTRDAPSLTILTSAFDFNQQEGTYYIEGEGFRAGRLLQADDGTSSNRHQIGIGSNLAFEFYTLVSGAVTTALSGATLPSTESTSARCCFAYKTSSTNAATSGSLPFGLDKTGALPTNITTIRLGSGTSALNGHISKFAYFSERLSNNELVALSTL